MAKGTTDKAVASTSTVPIPLPTATLTVTGSTHCPYRRATDLLQRLAPGKMRIGFLVGAGCPLAVQVHDGEKTKPLIPDITGLTKLVKDTLNLNIELKDVAQNAWHRVAGRGFSMPTVEDVLGHIRTLKSLCGNGNTIDGFPHDLLTKLDFAICEQIREIVKHPLPTRDTPYHALASWIQAIARDKPVEIFTTNYDLLLEQALEDQGVPYFDGFVGSDNAFLDLESMAEDDLPARWARLWKIHGSINWWVTMTEKKKIRRSRNKIEGEQLLIYPSHLKYDESRQMPYLAMIDRLRAFLRSEQCVLLTCGYSFGDEHINAYIKQGLTGNPNAACLGMIFNDRADAPKAVELARRHANLSLLAADGGIIGTVDHNWHSEVKDTNLAYPIAVGTDLPDWRTKAPAEQCKWLLGDFEAFGQFLKHQLSSRDIERSAIDAL
jgi:hypothetical protein